MIYTCQDLRDDSLPIGGKARHLFRIGQTGVPVPPWLVISAAVLEEVVGSDVIDAQDWGEARRRIHAHAHSEGFVTDLQHALSTLDLTGARLAVRSSSESEDGQEHAWAGMYTTVLNVAAAELLPAIARVWASAFSDEVVAYAKLQGGSAYRPSMAVIVQQLVEPDASAVAFGMHPVTGEVGCTVINATWGLGEGVVEGQLPTDSWTIRQGASDRVIADKTHGIFAAPGGGTERREIDATRRSLPSLTDAQVGQVVRVVERLGDAFGGPQDVELAVVGEELLVLQTRPITGLAPAPGSRGPPTLWDNNNLIDNYPGLTLPLTVSFVRETYRIGNRHLASLLGLSQRRIDSSDAQFANMVGAVRGRMYYNLSNIRALLRLLPASGVTIRYYDEAIGAAPDGTGGARIGGGDIVGIVRTVVALLSGFARLRRARQEFQDWIEPRVARTEATDFEALRPQELLQVYRDIEGEILGRWKAPALNGFLAMLFLGSLRRLAKRWEVTAERDNLVNELVAAGGDSVSKEIVDEVMALAELVRGDPARRQLFDDHDDEALPALVAAGSDAELVRRIDAYLKRYGDRSVGGELKFETPSYRERPALLFKAVRSHLGERRPEAPRQPEESAQALLSRALARRPLRRWVFGYLLGHTREMVRWREDFRFLRTRVFALARRVYRVLGAKLAAAGDLQRADDILWLTTPEVDALVEGELDPAEARGLIAGRRGRYAIYEGEHLPERIVWAGDPDEYVPPMPPTGSTGQRFVGIGCSPGVVRARVRIIRSPDDLGDLRGDVLVAVSTDTGWVQYFPTASAIVVERGSLLSHIAIVTRELGIPAVIGVRGIVGALQDGDLVQLDGSTGEVQILRTAADDGETMTE